MVDDESRVSEDPTDPPAPTDEELEAAERREKCGVAVEVAVVLALAVWPSYVGILAGFVWPQWKVVDYWQQTSLLVAFDPPGILLVFFLIWRGGILRGDCLSGVPDHEVRRSVPVRRLRCLL